MRGKHGGLSACKHVCNWNSCLHINGREEGEKELSLAVPYACISINDGC